LHWLLKTNSGKPKEFLANVFPPTDRISDPSSATQTRPFKLLLLSSEILGRRFYVVRLDDSANASLSRRNSSFYSPIGSQTRKLNNKTFNKESSGVSCFYTNHITVLLDPNLNKEICYNINNVYAAALTVRFMFNEIIVIIIIQIVYI